MAWRAREADIVMEQASEKRGMFQHRAASLLIVLFAFVAQTAHAFIDPPWITPAEPRAGEIVSVNIRMGICDATVFRPGYPQITRDGNTIRLVEYGHHWDGELCVYDIGTLTEPIGAYPPGDYTLTVDLIYQDYFGTPQILNIGAVPFTVRGAPPAAPVPMLDPLGLFALMVLLSGLGVWMLRTRRRGC
jgi:hypothetical protein